MGMAEARDLGASAVEYSLLVTGIAAIVILVVFSLGGFVADMFRDTCRTIDIATTITGASCGP